jgi:hypothetical protein
VEDGEPIEGLEGGNGAKSTEHNDLDRDAAGPESLAPDIWRKLFSEAMHQLRFKILDLTRGPPGH